jgi:uncharacterized protein YgbK (DUF1537 family)
MNSFRLVADDLTGALDAAAPFSSPERPIPVFTAGCLPAVLPVSYAVDLATRELDRGAASAVAARHAGLLRPSSGAIAFRKLDSLLRGSGGHELAATLCAIGPARCLIAPAFPFHGRTTCGGRQWVLGEGFGRPTGEDLRASLGAKGVPVRLVRAGDEIPPGVSLWDAATDDDLRRIANLGRRLPGPLLWCGSAGLAGALAPGSPAARLSIERPLLGVFGSDDPATAAQLAACAEHVLPMGLEDEASGAAVARRLAHAGLCLASFGVSQGTSRAGAAVHIARGIEGLAGRIEQPRSLVVAGGETLRSVFRSAGGERLEVFGQFAPGVPLSRLRGGPWDGTVVVSKSGAFGGPRLLRQIAGLDQAP